MITKFIVSVLIAIVVSFLCSLSEAILLSLNPLTMHRLRHNKPKAADSWMRMKRVIGRPIAAILILNTIAHTGGATVAGAAFVEFMEKMRYGYFLQSSHSLSCLAQRYYLKLLV